MFWKIQFSGGITPKDTLKWSRPYCTVSLDVSRYSCLDLSSSIFVVILEFGPLFFIFSRYSDKITIVVESPKITFF